jgi:hypothetical protein
MPRTVIAAASSEHGSRYNAPDTSDNNHKPAPQIMQQQQAQLLLNATPDAKLGSAAWCMLLCADVARETGEIQRIERGGR